MNNIIPDNPMNTATTDFNALIKNRVNAAVNAAMNDPSITKVINQQASAAVNIAVRNASIDKASAEIAARIVKDFDGFEPRPLEVTTSYGVHQVKSKTVHEKFQSVLQIVGNNMPVYLWGPTGSGKSLLARQVADGLGLKFHAMNSVTDEYKLTGFIDASGRYQSTEFRDAFENGGLFLLDEIDASAPDVLITINAALSNGWFPFPDKRIDANPNFRVIATGNTAGRGADTSYRGRTQLDAASLDRFVMVHVDYDDRIDSMLANGQNDIVDFIHAYRKAINASNVVNVTASHRRVSQMAVLAKFQDPVQVLRECLLTGLNTDDVRAISRAMPDDSNDNKWVHAFKAIAESR